MLNELKTGDRIMERTFKEKYRATVTFECEGKYIPMLDREIEFTSIIGAKRAINNLVCKMFGNLERFYGYGKRINLSATVIGHDIPLIHATIVTKRKF